MVLVCCEGVYWFTGIPSRGIRLQLNIFFLINCWSVVASVVLPRLCHLHCLRVFFVSFKLRNCKTVEIQKKGPRTLSEQKK